MPSTPEFRRAFRWAGAEVVVGAAEPGPVEAAARFLDLTIGPSLAEPTITLARDGPGHRIEGPFRPILCEARGDALYALVEALAHVFAKGARAPVLHAACLVVEGGAVLCLGAPFAGKSRLAFAALARGGAVIADDRAMLDPVRGTIEAFPKCPKLRLAGGLPEAAAGLIAAGDAVVGAIGEDRRLVISRRLPGIVGYGARLPLRAAVVIARAGRTEIASLPREEALGRLIESARGAAPMTLIRALRRIHPDGVLPLLRIGPDDEAAALDRLGGLVREREAAAANRSRCGGRRAGRPASRAT